MPSKKNPLCSRSVLWYIMHSLENIMPRSSWSQFRKDMVQPEQPAPWIHTSFRFADFSSCVSSDLYFSRNPDVPRVLIASRQSCLFSILHFFTFFAWLSPPEQVSLRA